MAAVALVPRGSRVAVREEAQRKERARGQCPGVVVKRRVAQSSQREQGGGERMYQGEAGKRSVYTQLRAAQAGHKQRKVFC